MPHIFNIDQKVLSVFHEHLTLAKAFRGVLVLQDPNDEPASVLLERIQAERSKHESKKRKNVKIRKTKRMEV